MNNFPLINRVSFELSNLCNLSQLHKNCPASKVKTPETLPMKIIEHVLWTLRDKTKKIITLAWYVYNEPMIDPRLFYLLDFSNKVLPDHNNRIITNAWNMTQTLLDELAEFNIDFLKLDAYSKEEFERLKNIGNKKIKRIKHCLKSLDDRMKLYDLKQKAIKDFPCFAPLADINIKANGIVALCCHDWKNNHIMGNLHKQTFESIVNSQKVKRFYKALSSGNRHLYNPCKSCNRQILGYACKRLNKYFDAEIIKKDEKDEY